MQNNMIKKGLVFGIIVLFIGASVVPTINGNIEKNISSDSEIEISDRFSQMKKINVDTIYIEDPKPPSSPILPSRQVLKPNDEGPHYKYRLKTQEWWYYNVVFDKVDSELRNWSLMMSFNQMKKLDMFFFTLFDDGNKTYGGGIGKPKGAIQATGPGVYVKFNKSYAIGGYPKWRIYAEDGDLDVHDISVDLIYEANSLPMWSIINTGRNISMSPMGHYCVIDCDVTGEIIINETVYRIHGVGYHEHSWLTFLPLREEKFNKLNVWDYFRIHFDNGWDMLAGRIYPLHQFSFMRFMPNILWFTPDGKNITECYFFKIEYLETKNTPIPGVEIPTKIHIKAFILNTIIKTPLKGLIHLDIYIETKNLHEYIRGSPPTAGMWEGTCKVNGTIKWSKNNIELNGWAITELIRAAS